MEFEMNWNSLAKKKIVNVNDTYMAIKNNVIIYFFHTHVCDISL